MQQQLNSASNKGVAISTTNKLVYIARVEARYGEYDIIRIIENARIGRVQYADMTAVKDNSPDAGPNPAFKFYSAFVMMTEWNPVALADLKNQGQIKLWTDPTHTAYWVLRPATEGSEIPRSKVNTHQLAHYTSELYDRMKAAEKKAEEQATIIEDQNTRMAHMLETMETMLGKNEEMANTIAKTAEIVSYMDAFMVSQFAMKEGEKEEESVVDV